MGSDPRETIPNNALAIIGMAGQFPGARNVTEFWRNLAQGVKSIRTLSDEELLAAGVSQEQLNDPHYVKRASMLDDIDLFDASFFGFSPREAETLDPQARLLLQCAWAALEDAGYTPQSCDVIGTFVGKACPNYKLDNLVSNPDFIRMIGDLQVSIYNDSDSLAPIMAYKLDLRGPSVSVQSFCSTSMLAVHLACQSLLAYECDLALAGGSAIAFPHGVGYLYQEGGILSPDGECRSLDANANGSIMGSGVGIVVLKRLKEALRDGDHIYAVIRGSATNNDGMLRVGYAAPGVNGQANVILEALSAAGVEAETISYVETQGIGTPLGDSIELEAMRQAFSMHTDKTNFCAIGSIRPNVGHLDRASGVTNVIATSMALHHNLLPPSLNFQKANPEIDLDSSPFYVNTQLQAWKSNGPWPRRAGTSSFGLGGTNVHMVLEEAPRLPPSTPSRPHQLLLLSAKTDSALEIATSNLVDYLRQTPEVNLADVAYTLQVGRAAFNHRRMVVCCDAEGGATALALADPQRVFTMDQTSRERPVAFMFPDVGDHYVGMGFDLYQTEPTFRKWVDECCALLMPHLQCDLRDVLYPKNYKPVTPMQDRQERLDLRCMLTREEESNTRNALQQTALAQPAVFVVEYALAQLLMEWGIQPKALTGYSLGEYTAACLAGVMSLEDALKLVARRVRMIETLKVGSQLTVVLPEEEIKAYLNDRISLAGILTPTTCVLTGAMEAIADLCQHLTAQGIACRALSATPIFHSAMMESLAVDLKALLQTVALNRPKIPYISNLTGTWITDEQATDPAYWVKHMCQTVQFAAGLDVLLQNHDQLLIEVGPGQSLGTFACQHPSCDRSQVDMILPTLRYRHEEQSDSAFLLATLGKAWLASVSVNWTEFYTHEFRYRVSLPTYPFERCRYWVEAKTSLSPCPSQPQCTGKKTDIGEWFYLPVWKQTRIWRRPTLDTLVKRGGTWLFFMDQLGLGASVADRLEAAGCKVVRVYPGPHFSKEGNTYYINPGGPQDYCALMQALPDAPTQIVHLWSVGRPAQGDSPNLAFDQMQVTGFYSFLYLIKAIKTYPDALNLWAITSDVQPVTGTEDLVPEKATLLGICRVIPQENLNIICHALDIEYSQEDDWQSAWLAEQIVAEFVASTHDLGIAYRGNTRWVQTFELAYLDRPDDQPAWRREGVYLIVGGLGEVGMVIGRHLAHAAQAKLILTARRAFPDRAEWEAWLASHSEADPISQRIYQFREWEAAGAQVWIAQADVSNTAQMQTLLSQIGQRFGELHGILYLAGVSGDAFFAPIQEITEDQCQAHFRSKVHGLYILENLLAERTLDFFVIFSSVSSVLGGLGLAAYAAANQFMDVFTHQHNRHHPQWWTVVNWDTWRIRKDSQDVFGATVAAYKMLPDEATEALERIVINNPLTQVVNSVGDLEARINQWVRMLSVRQAQAQPDKVLTSYPRPELSTAYVLPTTDAEKIIAEIWQTFLGLEPIGLYDNFLELGGHSLLATRIISRLRQKFQVHLPIALLLMSPTVAELALAVEMAIIEELDKLPDEAVSAHLKR